MTFGFLVLKVFKIINIMLLGKPGEVFSKNAMIYLKVALNTKNQIKLTKNVSCALH
jgi:hypothetical protein